MGTGGVRLSVSLDGNYANISKDATLALGFCNCLARDSQPGMFECCNFQELEGVSFGDEGIASVISELELTSKENVEQLLAVSSAVRQFLNVEFMVFHHRQDNTSNPIRFIDIRCAATKTSYNVFTKAV